jgi:predicted transcriptional regulator
MSDDETELELDTILSILENPIRRKILMKLARDTNYPLQLSKELNVSQQAVMKHLKVLEESDFVRSYEERSDKGGPPRKVYAPRKRYCIRIDIGPNTYAEEYYSYKTYDIKTSDDKRSFLPDEKRIVIKGKITGEMKSDVVAALPAFTDPVLERMRMELERIVNDSTSSSNLNDIRLLIQGIDNELIMLENKRKRLLAVRERTYQESNLLISNLTRDPLEKEVLSLWIVQGYNNSEEISEKLNIRKIIIDNILRKFKNILR